MKSVSELSIKGFFLVKMKFRMWYEESSSEGSVLTQLVHASDKEKAREAVIAAARKEYDEDQMIITEVRVMDTIEGE